MGLKDAIVGILIHRVNPLLQYPFLCAQTEGHDTPVHSLGVMGTR